MNSSLLEITNHFLSCSQLEDEELEELETWFEDLFHEILPHFNMPSRKKIIKITKNIYFKKKDLIKCHLKTIK